MLKSWDVKKLRDIPPMVFQPWQKIMNGMFNSKQTPNCVFSTGEKKDLDFATAHPQVLWCSKVNHPHGPMVLCLGIHGNPMMATAEGSIAGGAKGESCGAVISV
jgi:hypothetical protein